MHAQIVKGEAIFSELSTEWNLLAGQGMTDTPFQTLAYQRSWWQNLHPEGSELNSIVVRDADDRLIAIACLYVTADGEVRFNGCVEETDYLDLIVTAQDAAASWEAILTCLLSDEYPAWRHLELCNVPELSQTRIALAETAARHGYTVIESINEVCPVIALPATFDAYLSELDSKQRREISRKLRRAQGAEAKLHVVDSSEDLGAAVNDFLELLQKSTFDKRDWLNEGRRALFHETAAAAQEANILQLMFVEIDHQKAAALFNFDYGDRIWVYNSGLDPEAFSALSPGVVITAWAIELAIENGRSNFDFLRGDEEYKYRFGAKDTSIYKLEILR